MTDAKPETMMIDDVKYVREDALGEPAVDIEGRPYAIVRSRNQGVMAGYVDSVEGQTVRLLKARQLWRWNSAFTLVELANDGPGTGTQKFSAEAKAPVTMLEACGVLECTDKAAKALRAVEAFRA